ncbi:MAG: hypothetical protein OXK72_07940 [Gammaproteobacteria bacterium]|nr:hypothetical protein [Gammaproteobacteria bacterium]
MNGEKIADWHRKDVQTVAYNKMNRLIEVEDTVTALILQLEAVASTLLYKAPLASQIEQLRKHKDMLSNMADTFAEMCRFHRSRVAYDVGINWGVGAKNTNDD